MSDQNYSVLMSVYFKEKPEYLRESMLSIYNQTVKTNDFVLVCDGLLNDELDGVINEMQQLFGNVLNVVRLPENVGLGRALNEGIRHCKNELVARMDSDDISLKDRCEKQLEIFSKKPQLVIVGCSVAEFIDDPNNIVSIRSVPCKNDDILKFAKKRSPFNHPSVMFKRGFVQNVGGYSDLRKSQDMDLWIRILSNGAVAENIEECLLFFRFDEDTYRKRKNWLSVKTQILIRWKAFRIGFCSLWDFIEVAVVQLAVFILPIRFQKLVYSKFLRVSV